MLQENNEYIQQIGRLEKEIESKDNRIMNLGNQCKNNLQLIDELRQKIQKQDLQIKKLTEFNLNKKNSQVISDEFDHYSSSNQDSDLMTKINELKCLNQQLQSQVDVLNKQNRQHGKLQENKNKLLKEIEQKEQTISSIKFAQQNTMKDLERSQLLNKKNDTVINRQISILKQKQEQIQEQEQIIYQLKQNIEDLKKDQIKFEERVNEVNLQNFGEISLLRRQLKEQQEHDLQEQTLLFHKISSMNNQIEKQQSNMQNKEKQLIKMKEKVQLVDQLIEQIEEMKVIIEQKSEKVIEQRKEEKKNHKRIKELQSEVIQQEAANQTSILQERMEKEIKVLKDSLDNSNKQSNYEKVKADEHKDTITQKEQQIEKMIKSHKSRVNSLESQIYHLSLSNKNQEKKQKESNQQYQILADQIESYKTIVLRQEKQLLKQQ